HLCDDARPSTYCTGGERVMNLHVRRTLPSIALCVAVAPIFAQSSTQQPVPALRTARAFDRTPAVWAASSVLLAASFVFDERLRQVALANHARSLDRIAAGADVLATAGHIVPALAATYIGARAFGGSSFANAVLRVGLSYAAADAVESLLKPAVGRVRPDLGREPLTFRPFSTTGDYQSFPSAHVVHIASLASAVAMEAH